MLEKKKKKKDISAPFGPLKEFKMQPDSMPQCVQLENT